VLAGNAAWRAELLTRVFGVDGALVLRLRRVWDPLA